MPKETGRKAVLKESFLWNQPCKHFSECPLSINGPRRGETESPISSSGRWAEREIGEKLESPELSTFRGYFLLFIVLEWLTNSDREVVPKTCFLSIKTKHCSDSLRVKNKRMVYVLLKVIRWGKNPFFRNSIFNLLHKVVLLILSCSFLKKHKTLDVLFPNT